MPRTPAIARVALKLILFVATALHAGSCAETDVRFGGVSLVDHAGPGLRVAAATPFGSWNPNRAAGWNEVTAAVHAALYRRPEAGGVEGDLMASRTFEDGARTLVVCLQPRAQWHHGGGVSAADVVASFRDAADDAESPIGKRLRPVINVKARDPLTVAFTTAEPWAEIEDALADLAILPLGTPADTAAAADPALAGADPRERNGAGPFRLVAAANTTYVLSAHARWHGGRPLLGSVQVIVMPDAPARARVLLRGGADLGFVAATDAHMFHDAQRWVLGPGLVEGQVLIAPVGLREVPLMAMRTTAELLRHAGAWRLPKK